MTTSTAGHNTLAEQIAERIRRHRAGDAQAMSEIVGCVTPWLHHVAFSCGLSRHSADDVAQSTMESVLAHLPSLRDPDCGLAWMSIIARREAIRVSREERRIDPVEDPETLHIEIDSADPEQIAMAHIYRDVLLRAIAKLSERQRGLLHVLFFDGGYDDREPARHPGRQHRPDPAARADQGPGVARRGPGLGRRALRVIPV